MSLSSTIIYRESMKEVNYFNGEIVAAEETKIHISDLAFLRGYGIFDFLRAINGQPVFIEDHLDRFETAAKIMGLTIPESRETLREIIAEIIRLNPNELLGIKMILTGGYSPDGFTPAEKSNFLVTAKPFVFSDPALGQKLMSYEYQREIPEVKTLSYIPPIKMLPKLRAMQADDFLYFKDGLISESSRSNVFIVRKQNVITPKTGILPGITRKYVMKACQGIFELEERDVTLAETVTADEVFITSSNQRIVPVIQIDNQVINDGQPGVITKKLQSLLLGEE
jgi:D-alanine transaminase/branched-chain amino acid aminotransferase